MDVHHGLISEMQASLNGMLKPKYHVRIAERVYISDENDLGRMVIIPDLRIAVRPGQEGTAFVPGGGTTLEVAEPIIATTMIEDEIHEARLEVIDRARRLVVTVIEVLSPTNKIAGARGQASFEWKRREVMNSPSHWVEIDLLRAGLPLFGEGLLPPHEYVVHISRVDRRPKGLLWSRADRRPKGLLWPIRLSQRLPVLPIPLKPEDPDAPLDLQAVLATAYDRAAYDLEIDYRAEPVPPLEGEWAAWADRLLREKGLR